MLEGFTLFRVTKGWQCSTKQAEQNGWSVRIIGDEQAQRILAQLSQDQSTETGNTNDIAKRRELIKRVVDVATQIHAKRRVMLEE